MTAPAISLHSRRQWSDLLSAIALIGFAAASATVLGVWAQEPNRVRLAVLGVACLGVLALLAHSPQLLLYAALAWLSVLGLVRRLLDEAGSRPHSDPILLVSPFAFGLLVLFAWKHGAFAHAGRLAKAVLLLQVLVVLGAMNPLQGSVSGGLASLLFVLVPTFGFWIGRGLCGDRAVAGILRLVAVLSVMVAVYGLGQIVVGFPSWDRRWIEGGALGSLNVNGAMRSFGTLSSASEYGAFLAVGLIIWLAYWFRPRATPIVLPAMGLLATAVFLESSRGLVVGTVAAIGVVLAAKARLPGLSTIAVAVVLIAGLGFVVRHVAVHNSRTATGTLVNHQVQGLSNPLDPNASTATAHYSLLVDGLRASLRNPIGEGTGVVTIAGSRFGGVAAGTELDPSNVSTALGIPGLIVYLLVAAMGFRLLYRRVRERGDGISAAALGIATVLAMQWLNGGQYAVALLPWLMLGWADGRMRTESD